MTNIDRSQTDRTDGLQLSAMIRRAKSASDRSQVGQLLDLYRNYLNLIAQQQINGGLRARVEASDVVQETFIDAHRDFSNFRGQTESELVAWLRKILARNILDQARRHRTKGRDFNREQSLQRDIDQSNQNFASALDANMTTPSGHAARREQAVLIADAIANLPDHYRKVIVMRQIQRVSFPEIAEELGTSTVSIRAIWHRALKKLKQSLE